MSDVGYFLGTESFIEEIETEDKKQDIKSERHGKLIMVALVVFCFLLIAEFALCKFIKPSLQSPKVTVMGQNILSAEDIARKLLPLNSTNWFSFDVEKAASILAAEACIRNVSVEKHFPDKIFVRVEERTPVAMTFVENEGKSIPMQIDETGVIFSGKVSSDIQNSSIPIISGIPVEYMTNGMRIPSKYRPLIEQVSHIQELPQRYFAAVSEICVVPKEYGSYELVLIPSSGHVKVLTDRSLNEDALKYMMVMLDIVKRMSADVNEVDLRYGSVSYRS